MDQIKAVDVVELKSNDPEMTVSHAGAVNGTTKICGLALVLLLFASAAALFGVELPNAQASQPQSTPAPPPAVGAEAHATLAQVMAGILYFNANVVFSVQSQDPGTVKPDTDPTMQTKSMNPISSIFGGWEAIENSSLALSESANLLNIPGRLCSNGRPVPLQNADWAKFVQQLRDAGLAAYKAAQSKNLDAVVEVTEQVSTSCNNCHRVYRYRRSICAADLKEK